MPAFTLETAEFDTLRRMLRDHSGIWLADGKHSFLQVRLAARMEARGISAPREYVHFLKYDGQGGEELQALLDVVTVNETWFFREATPIEAWRDVVLPGLLQRGRRVRMWSAGCSTGEEAYTLAMTLHAALPPPALAACEILATDISQRALEAARQGQYDPYSLRHTAAAWREHYFEPAPPPAPAGRQILRADVRRLVHFGRANLIDGTLPGRVGQLDLILCRNVMIYFDRASRDVALANLFAALRPGGYLVLGASESLAHAPAPFTLERVGGLLLYRRLPAVRSA
jgi:chemotaxis protein methyltransferase CheR